MRRRVAILSVAAAIAVWGQPLWIGAAAGSAIVAMATMWGPLDARRYLAPMLLLGASATLILGAATWRGLPF